MKVIERSKRPRVPTRKQQHAQQALAPNPVVTLSKATIAKATIASVLRNHPLPFDFSDGLPTRRDIRSDKAIRMTTRYRHGELGAVFCMGA